MSEIDQALQMNKTIVIGIGGTGLEAIRSLRRRVVESRGSLAALPRLGFFYIDTDETDIKNTRDNDKRWEVLGTSVALSPSEYFILPAPDVGQVVRNISAYRSIEEWLPVEKIKTIDQADRTAAGARQIRPLGRLGFTLHADDVEREFKKLYNKLPSAPGGGKTQIFVVCSLSGGTGAGIFLDLAYRLKVWTTGNSQTHAFLVFPDLQAVRDKRYLPNAYAALMELNYFTLSGQSVKGGPKIGFRIPGSREPIYDKPFDFCYIVSPRNSQDVTISLGAVPEMIAHRIHMTCDSSFADAARQLLDNGGYERTVPFEDPVNGNLEAQNFFTFGLSSVEYPVDQIQEMIAWRISSALFKHWIEPRPTKGNINEMVRSTLSELRLTDDFLQADKDIFGGSNNFEDYRAQVTTYVNQVKAQAPMDKQVAFFSEKEREFVEQFRHAGVTSFFLERTKDIGRDETGKPGAVDEVLRPVDARVCAYITDPEFGFDFARHWLGELIQYLQERQEAYTQELAGATTRAKNGGGATLRAYNELTQAEGKILMREKAIMKARQLVGAAITVKLTAVVATNVIPYSQKLLSRIIEGVKQLHDQMDDWRIAVQKLVDDADEEQRRIRTFLSGKIEGDKNFNGSILFREEPINRAFGSLDVSSAHRFLVEMLKKEGRDVLSLLSTTASAAATRDGAYRLALKWMADVSQIRITEKTVADQLLEDYPESQRDQRCHLLQVCKRRASPFLALDQMQRKIWGEVTTISSDQVALMDDEQGAYPNVVTIQRDLKERLGYPAESVKQIAARHQILFLQEICAFPLRMISDLPTLRERYLKHWEPLMDTPGAEDRIVPLHLQESYNPPLMDLLLVDAEAYKAAEEDFLVGWVEGRIKEEENKTERVQEIRYRYVESGSSKYVALGQKWELALEEWLRDTTRATRLRERLNEENERFFRSLNTQPKRAEFGAKLTKHLDALRATFETGEEDRVYQRWDKIRQRIVKKRNLPTTITPEHNGTAVADGRVDGATVRSSSSPSPNLEKFKRLVETTVKSLKGATIPPAMQELLERRGKALDISEAEARQIFAAHEPEAPKSTALDLYRHLVEQFLEDGDIDDEERVMLLEMQVDNDIDPDAAEEIEKQVRARLEKV